MLADLLSVMNHERAPQLMALFFFVLRLGYDSHLDFFLFSARVARGYFVIILHP